MKRIAITQRRDRVPNRSEVRDALDVTWSKYLFQLGILPIPVCSELADTDGYIDALGIQGVILSGGNDLGQMLERDKMERRLLDHAKNANLPVLGICRGMKMMNHYFGGSLVDVKGHVATRHKLNGNWSKEHGYTEVNSYHNQGIDEKTLAPNLTCLAQSDDGVIEAIKHETLEWYGIMWHPEREPVYSEVDQGLIKRLFCRSKV